MLSAPLAGIKLPYGLTNHRAEQIKTMEVADGRIELRAVTGPDYGRIYDAAECTWAQDWLVGILGREGAMIDPAARDHLWSALTSLASAPARGTYADRPLGPPAVGIL